MGRPGTSGDGYGAGDRKRLQLAGLDMCGHGTGGREHDLHLACEHIVQCRAATSVTDPDEIDISHRFEEFSGNVIRGADRPGRIVDLPRIGLGERDQLLYRGYL